MPEILVLAGDGIGPEVVPPALMIARQAARTEGIELEFVERPCGAGHYLATGRSIDDDTRELARRADAVFLGAVGLPDVRRGDGTEVADEVVLDFRNDLDLAANVRPVRSWPNLPGPLSRQDIDFVVVRENTEGLYASRTGGIVLHGEIATDTMVMTRRGVERAVRQAFELASQSHGAPRDGRRKVTCVDKANTLRSYVFFRKVFLAVSHDYPEIHAECELADAMAARMILKPGTLNVIVCENMIGDLLSDLAAASVGGLGVAPSANLGERHAMFEPTHGSAPDIAGAGTANPVAAILSAAMMLRWLGKVRGSEGGGAAADRIEHAVARAFIDDIKTPDLGGSASTTELATAIAERL